MGWIIQENLTRWSKPFQSRKNDTFTQKIAILKYRDFERFKCFDGSITIFSARKVSYCKKKLLRVMLAYVGFLFQVVLDSETQIGIIHAQD